MSTRKGFKLFDRTSNDHLAPAYFRTLGDAYKSMLGACDDYDMKPSDFVILDMSSNLLISFDMDSF